MGNAVAIIGIDIENFKGIKALAVTLGAGMTVLSGRNAQGKSSVIDALESLLGVDGSAPESPIRKGSESARVVAELDNGYVVRRVYTAKTSRLEITTADGDKKARPQEYLDALYSKVAIKWIDFMRSPAAKQAAVLRQIAGLDTSKLDAERLRVYDQRTEANRDVKRLDTEAAAVIVPPQPEEIGEEIDLLEMVSRRDVRQANDRERAKLTDITAKYKAAKAECDRLLDEGKAQRALVMTLVDPPEEDLSGAKLHNEAVRQRKANAENAQRLADEKARKIAAFERAKATADALTTDIERIDANKATVLAAAKFPVEGLGVDGDTVTYRGVPLSHASQAEKVRVSLAVGCALDPQLRAIAIRDGSLLDADGMAIIEQFAADHGLQVIVERVVDKTKDGVGLVIEDGELYADRRAEARNGAEHSETVAG